ncbi:MAG: DUF934 domain-containing protein [Burkholderiales bacterium]
MATIIKHRRIVNDSWQLLEPAADGSVPPLPESGDVIVPLAVWLERRNVLLPRPGRLGVWLDGGDEPALIAEDLKNFGVVAIRFPRFTDGRGYSLARLLRQRYGWRGELRAIGDVLRDQLFYLARCGFDAFALRADQDPQAALAAFDDFSESYQAAVEPALPLFRRRLLASADGMEWS